MALRVNFDCVIGFERRLDLGVASYIDDKSFLVITCFIAHILKNISHLDFSLRDSRGGDGYPQTVNRKVWTGLGTETGSSQG